ncbi:hypothetical protein KSP39_PZI002793 [Platanthera zijinensis]|uniref:Uncharacterized protein n=1 Tax=Platanthera zijinensis TaxID=2320716 RepID=A0AAP0GE90_9ASPA
MFGCHLLESCPLFSHNLTMCLKRLRKSTKAITHSQMQVKILIQLPGQSSQSGVTQNRKRKGKRQEAGTKQIMLVHVDKLFSSSETIMQRVTTPIVPPSIYLVRGAIQELEKYPEIFEDCLLYHFATVHIHTPVNRVTFLSIPEDRRVEWLKTHYMNSNI